MGFLDSFLGSLSIPGEDSVSRAVGLALGLVVGGAVAWGVLRTLFFRGRPGAVPGIFYTKVKSTITYHFCRDFITHPERFGPFGILSIFDTKFSRVSFDPGEASAFFGVDRVQLPKAAITNCKNGVPRVQHGETLGLQIKRFPIFSRQSPPYRFGMSPC